ncbi:MAG: nucleotidyltransferase family protein [Gemmatimonadaceae bacterium]
MSDRSEPGVAAIVLAAGASTRFGSQKLLALLDGAPLVRWAAIAAAHSLAADVVVVLAPGATELSDALEGLPVRCVVAADSRSGMSASLRAGLDALEPGIGAAVIILGDQPMVSVAAIDALIGAYVNGGATIAQPLYANGERGHPVLFSSELFGELRGVGGDRGGRDVIARTPHRVTLVTLDLAAPHDIDTMADFDTLRNAARE